MQNNFFGSKLNTILLLILIVFMIFALRVMLKDKETYLPLISETSKEIKLSGLVTDKVDECYVDGVCAIEIKNKYWIDYMHDTRIEQRPRGTTEGTFEVGSMVEVYAVRDHVIDGYYTIFGDEKYYIKVIESEYIEEPRGENRYKSLTDDLNGDGLVESISLEVRATPGASPSSSFAESILRINSVSFNSGVQENPEPYFGVVDINKKDKLKEIAMLDRGPSDDPITTFLAWDGNKIINYGSIPSDYYFMKFDGNNKITTRIRGHILQTWFYEADYVLSGSKIISSPRDFYEIVDGPEDLMMLQDLSVVKSQKDISVVATFKKGEKINLIGCDDIAWCKAKNQAGIEGWFALENFDQIKGTNFSARDVFEGLSYAD